MSCVTTQTEKRIHPAKVKVGRRREAARVSPTTIKVCSRKNSFKKALGQCPSVPQVSPKKTSPERGQQSLKLQWWDPKESQEAATPGGLPWVGVMRAEGALWAVKKTSYIPLHWMLFYRGPCIITLDNDTILYSWPVSPPIQSKQSKL